MSSSFVYVVDRDFGFAPNPFHGSCTLATCKPKIRRVAVVGDWVIGMGGRRLKATGRCIFAMRIDAKMGFNDYWNHADYQDKRPARNGSSKMLVGDNIYVQTGGVWRQADSHHSHPDGTTNIQNVDNDTQTDAVLISWHFYYFGRNAVEIPAALLTAIGYRNSRNHRRFALSLMQPIVQSIRDSGELNVILGDPFDFEAAHARYTVSANKVI